MSEKAPPAMDRRAAMRRLFRTYLAPHWVGIAICLALAVGVGVLTALLLYQTERTVAVLLVQKRAEMLLLLPLSVAAIGVLRALFSAAQLRLINRIGHTVVGHLQSDLFARLMNADLLRLRSVHSGQHVSKMLFDANLVRDGSTHVAVNYVQQSFIALGSIVYMASVDIALTALALVAAPLVFAIIKKYEKRTRRAAIGAMGETSALSTVILEGLDGVKVVKIEGREAFEQERVEAVIRRRQAFLIRGSNAKALSSPVSEGLMVVVIAAILVFAGWRALQGNVNAAEFGIFLAAVAQASQAIRQLGGMQSTIGEAGAAAARLFETLDIEPTITDAPGASPLRAGDSTVRFENVTFAFGEQAPAVREVSLEIRKGESVALVGPSGSGKSTILNLIPRFYDVTAGKVTIDGQDVREVTLRSLRSRIALVTQEPFLFDDTIRNNIAYARPDASEAEIEEAARQAAAHEFITGLPNGYDTLVGEAGARLSGGQRQRIAIARAFLKDAPILLLDEATSALDTESEAQVQAALTRLMSGRATLVIAHRLSTIRDATKILVLEDGRIVETGSHGELMRGEGLYARLAAAQHLDVLEVAG